MKEKVTCIFNVTATSTKWIQCILEVIYELMLIKVTKPTPYLVKYLIPFRFWQPNMFIVAGLINFKILFLKVLRLGAFEIEGHVYSIQ